MAGATVAERKAEILKKTKYHYEDLCEIVDILRHEEGCPWDREQDHHSIRKGMIEECYEVVEAIDKEDSALLREELGDVLLQVLFHADLEKDAGRFTQDDVAHDECVKMITRHPHVFGNTVVDSSAQVLQNWEKIKTDEKQRVTLSEKLRSIPPMLPALMRAQKVEKKANDVHLSNPEPLHDAMQCLEQLSGTPDVGKEKKKALLGQALQKLTAYAYAEEMEAEELLSTATDGRIEELIALYEK